MLELKLRLVAKCEGIEGVTINYFANNKRIWIRRLILKPEIYIIKINDIFIDDEKITYSDKGSPDLDINEKEMWDIIETWRQNDI